MTDSIFTSADREAVAALFRDVGAALVRFGRTLDATVAVAPARTSTAPGSLDNAAAPTTVSAAAAVASEVSRKLGQRQQALIALVGLREDIGLSSAEVATQLAIAIPNAHAALSTLVARGLIEQVGEDKPARWRLVDRGRSTPSAARNKRVPKAPGPKTNGGRHSSLRG